MIRWLTLGLIGIGIVGFILASHLWSLWVVLIIIGGLAYWFTSHRPLVGGERKDITLPSVPASAKGGWGRVIGGKDSDIDETVDDGRTVVDSIPVPSTGTTPMPPSKPIPTAPPKAEPPQAEPAKNRQETLPPPPPVAPSQAPGQQPPIIDQSKAAEPKPDLQPEPEPTSEDEFGGEPYELPEAVDMPIPSLDDGIFEEIPVASDKVHFSAYYPKEVQPDIWQPLHAYIYRQSVEAQTVADATKLLGEKMGDFRRTTDSAPSPLAEGATITATPTLEGFQFNPPSITIGFFKDWHRLDFEMRAKTAPLNLASNGRLTFTVEGIIVADIPLSIFVSATPTNSDPIRVSQKIYEAIFASYSHHDAQIVERVERACKSLGLDYLRDVTTLKSGQHWSDELLDLIARADIFQLFWSSASAESEFVQKEWAYALQLRQKETTFIRPVYWQQPMPEPPTELSHLHFAYQPDLQG